MRELSAWPVVRGAQQTPVSALTKSYALGRFPFSARTVFFSSSAFFFLNFIFGGSFNKTLIHGTAQPTADESKDEPQAL